MKKYNKRNGWYTNWDALVGENEIYALIIKGTVDIQGLVAVAPDYDKSAIYVSWMCASPQNNKQIKSDIKYSGVGGQLFAIAAKKSIDYGFEGYLYGFAANEKLLNHYVEKLKGEVIAILHPYQFAVDEKNSKEIMEVYRFEWTDEEI